MSKQRIDGRTREAIWLAHGQRCFYCDRPVLFADVEIDHFIFESISDNELAGLIERGVLPPDFDVQSDENLVPSCRRDNCDKHNLQFTDRFVAIQISRTREKAKKVRSILRKEAKLYELDKIFRHLQKAVDADKYSPQEAWDYMRKLRRAPTTAEFLGASVPPSVPQVLVTERALHGLRNSDLRLDRLGLVLERAASEGRLKVLLRDEEAGRYVMRLDDQRRIYFRVVDDLVILESVEQRAEGSPH